MDLSKRREALSSARRETAMHIAQSRTSCDESRDHVLRSKVLVDRSLGLLRSTSRLGGEEA